METLIFPLTKEDRNVILRGDMCLKVFPNPLDFKPLYVFIATHNLSEKDLKVPLDAGCNCAPILVKKSEIKRIEKQKDCLRAKYKGFEILIVTQEMHEELVNRKEGELKC